MTDTVDELLEERIDGEIASVLWYKSVDAARYGLVGSLTDDGRLNLTTVILDVDDETLRIHSDNSMWLPGEPEILEGAMHSIARSMNEMTIEPEDVDPLSESLLEYDAERIGAFELEDDYEPGEEDTDWKEREGRDEIHDVRDRFEEAGLEPVDRFIRLEWEGKAPWEGEPQRIMRSPGEIAANYGVEVSEEDDLVILDLDDLDAAPLEELPETLRSESPHGGEHRFYRVPGWQAEFNDRFGVDNPHSSIGEVRAQDGYVVGPGCILTSCKHGCCTDEDPGRYVLDDRPVATIAAERLADLIEPFRGEDDA